MQARYLELLQLTGREKVLEVGTGSGYQTALLALLADRVFSIERVPELTRDAQKVMQELGIKNVTIMGGDGTLGWRPYAPFDAILVAAASPEVPKPLLEQAGRRGRLVIPIGDRDRQVLHLVTRRESGFETATLGDVRFVPLIGEHGFQS